jgi:two-component sensor histidine kinase
MAGRPEGYVLLLSCGFRGGQLAALRRRVLRAVRRCGLGSDAADGFLIAVNEAMTNAVRHGGGVGRLGLWIARQTADHLAIESGPVGTTVTITAERPA